MTLTKQKRTTKTHHKKRVGAHHRQGHSYSKAYWPYLPILAVMFFGLVLNSWLHGLNKNVLGYATEMSPSSLVSGTNAQRAANGLGALALNATLSQAAQSKAQDMLANNYWAHTSPTGVTPWYWISSVGYSYTTAGENLAYGFTSSSDTITGWMNSPGHRANILNTSFTEVGFGVVNAPNFVGTGPQTIVVALYARPVSTPAPVQAPTPPPAPAAASVPTAKSAPAPTAQSTTPAVQPESPVPTESPKTEPSTPAEPAQPAKTAALAPKTEKATASSNGGITEKQQPVNRFQTLSATNASWGGFLISLVASVALLAFLLRHSLAWHRFMVKGEQFVIHHPVADVAFVAIAVLGFILIQTSGIIK